MYTTYLSGLENSIIRVNEIKACNDVFLTEKEVFDYNFKRELYRAATRERKYSEGRTAGIRDVDYRVARFFADCFHEIMVIHESKEFSFKEIVQLAKKYCRVAFMKGITSCKYNIAAIERNGVLSLYLRRGMKRVAVMDIRGITSMAVQLVNLVAYLGTEGYVDEYYRDSLMVYMSRTLREVLKNHECRPYVDKEIRVKDLESGLGRDRVVSRLMLG